VKVGEMTFSENMAVLLVVLLASSVLCTAEEGFSSGLKSILDSSTGGNGIEWDYSDGPTGPAHWGDLSPEFAACSNGVVQSPIAITEENVKLDSHLDVPSKIYYHPAHASVFGDGKTLEVTWSGGIFNCHDFDYVLDKLVFHSPSEHTYLGERFPLEIQFYHSHPTEGYAVNSLVFKEGEPNKWLNQFTSSLSEENLGKSINLGLVDSAGVGGEDLDWSRYYRYFGSITTPPCYEKIWVVWSLLKAPLTASKEQLEKVAAALQHTPNARPIQPSTSAVYYPMYVDGSN
jgi:carbonic anhydrase